MKHISIVFAISALAIMVMGISCKSRDQKHESKATGIRPNILFCIADDATLSSFGAYGDTFINTPEIDKLAKEGLVFENAYNCNPKCSPARACIVTGMYSWQLKEAANHFPKFPDEFKFYPHILMKNGYHVGYTGKGWGPGEYPTEHNPAGPAYNSIMLDPPYKGISKIDYVSNFENFLDERPEEPFCFWMGTKEPHRIYERDSYRKAGKKLDEVEVQPFYPDNDVIRGDLLDYAVEIEWIDAQIGKAMESLEKRGLLNNTMVIFTSDHGMPFPRVKGQLYEEGFHVPFIVYWKGKITSGVRLKDFINFPDVAPTILELAGLPPDVQMTGKSFKDILFVKESGHHDKTRDHVLLGKERHDTGRANEDGIDLGYPVRAIRNKDFLYVHNIKPERWPSGNPEYGFNNVGESPTKSFIMNIAPAHEDYKFYTHNFGMRPEEELFDINKDPHCMNNLAMLPEYREVCRDLRLQMESELIAQGDPRTLGHGDVFDNYQYYGKLYDYVNKKKITNPYANKKKTPK